MIRMLMLSTALVVSAPALAQQAMNPAAPADAQSATTAEPTSPTATPEAAKPTNATDAVASIVDTEFPAYDGNKDGQLDQSEFSRWMVALKDQEMKATGKSLPQDQVTAWASGAFTTADSDKSVSISKPELITYLSGGAA